ncbi:MAG: ATP-binding protein [Syntrophobacteraceae bacterium]
MSEPGQKREKERKHTGASQREASSCCGVNASLEFYKFVIDSIPLAVVTMDAEYRITGFNPRAEELTGYRAETVFGRSCREVLRSALCDDACPLRTVMNRQNGFVTTRTTLQDRLGKTIFVDVSTAALFDDEGKCLGAVEAIADISARVAMEREHANFISMLAHDMRSSLTGIHGLGLRLLRKPADMDETKVRKHLEIITKEAGKLEALVDDLLELSRIESGRLRLTTTAVSLDKELEEIFETFKEKASQQGIQLELRVGDLLPVIEADASRLRRVFGNLLDNAIKFSPRGGTIVITTQETDCEVMVTVRDSGIGILTEDLPYIFDIFHRGKTTLGKEGHGLGLATVKAIVEGHGGRIMVSSEPDVGSTFTVFLPKLPDANGA